jgi:glutamyl-tRNA reductase
MLDSYKILTITHRETPLQSIGKFVIAHENEGALQARLEALKAEFGVDEMLYLATCNRVLFLLHTEKALDKSFVQKFFQAVNPELSNSIIEKYVTRFEGKNAADHLLKVASSIDSLVVGEREILRQLREAYDRCLGWNLTGDNIRILLQAAVAAAKEVYDQTRLGERSVSVVSLAVKELLKTKLPKNARILMIGAGQTNMLVTKFLAKYGFNNVSVFNRTLEKAQQVAAMTSGKAYSFNELENYGEGFDCLIVCTGATQAVVDKTLYAKLLAGETTHKVVIDLSVPNNVCREVTRDFDVHFIEVEGLRALAQENLSFREQEVTVAVQMLEQHLEEFEITARNRRIERALHRIPTEVTAVKERALNEVFKKEVEVLDDSTRQLLERMMTYMEKKCTGIPMKVAREALTVPV